MNWKERLKAVGWSVVFLFGGYLLAFLFLIPVGYLIPGPGSGPLSAAAVQSAGLLFGYGVLTWLIGGKLLRLSRADFERLGPEVRRSHRWRGFGWGTLVGTILAALAMVIAVPLSHAAWQDDGGTPLQWFGTLVVTGLVLLPAALVEELAFRGVPLIALSRALGRVPALLALALLFSLGHLGNPAVTRLGMANIALAGVFLGLAFFTPGGLWTSTGAHLGWNLTLAGLAAPVSGIPLPMPWLDYSPGIPLWLTGGSFGPEGGALATLCLVGGSMLAVGRGRRKERVRHE